METGHRYKVSPERLEKPGIEPTTTHLQGEWLIHCATEASKINVVQSSIRDRVAAKSDLKYFMRRCKYNQLISFVTFEQFAILKSSDTHLQRLSN